MAGSKRKLLPQRDKDGKQKKMAPAKQHEMHFLLFVYWALRKWQHPAILNGDTVHPSKLFLAQNIVQMICSYLPSTVWLSDSGWYFYNPYWKKLKSSKNGLSLRPQMYIDHRKSASLSSNVLSKLVENFTITKVLKRKRSEIREKINQLYLNGDMVAKTWKSIISAKTKDKPEQVAETIRSLLRYKRVVKAKGVFRRNKDLFDSNKILRRALKEEILEAMKKQLEKDLGLVVSTSEDEPSSDEVNTCKVDTSGFCSTRGCPEEKEDSDQESEEETPSKLQKVNPEDSEEEPF